MYLLLLGDGFCHGYGFLVRAAEDYERAWVVSRSKHAANVHGTMGVGQICILDTIIKFCDSVSHLKLIP